MSEKESQGRAPRRIVLLQGSEDRSPVESVLLEFPPDQVSGTRLHAELVRLAGDHPGRHVAAEWLGPLGWTRFLWCHR